MLHAQNLEAEVDIHHLFRFYNALYFDSSLDFVSVHWSSSRMTLCAGVCEYQKGSGCRIKLSEPLLKFRPVSDLKTTLLHEMIHAFLCLGGGKLDRDSHGPQFLAKMAAINQAKCPDPERPGPGYQITVYHTMNEEVAFYRKHWWECSRCKDTIKRAMNRQPQAADCRGLMGKGPACADPKCHFHTHLKACGPGTYVKTKSPPPPVPPPSQPKPTSVKSPFSSQAASSGKPAAPKPTPAPSAASGHAAAAATPLAASAGPALPVTDTHAPNSQANKDSNQSITKWLRPVGQQTAVQQQQQQASGIKRPAPARTTSDTLIDLTPSQEDPDLQAPGSAVTGQARPGSFESVEERRKLCTAAALSRSQQPPQAITADAARLPSTSPAGKASAGAFRPGASAGIAASGSLHAQQTAIPAGRGQSQQAGKLHAAAGSQSQAMGAGGKSTAKQRGDIAGMFSAAVASGVPASLHTSSDAARGGGYGGVGDASSATPRSDEHDVIELLDSDGDDATETRATTPQGLRQQQHHPQRPSQQLFQPQPEAQSLKQEQPGSTYHAGQHAQSTGCPESLPKPQGQANTWLQAFSSTDEAWHAALQLLQPAVASEVQFFACNMLLSKIRSSWGCLTSENKAGLFSALTQTLAALLEQPSTPLLVRERMVLVCAAVVAMTGGDAVTTFVGRAVALASAPAVQSQSSVLSGLAMLASLAEETDSIDRGRRLTLVPLMHARLPEVLQACQTLLGQALAAGCATTVVRASLRCLLGWLKTTASGGGGCCRSPGELQLHTPMLLPCLLQFLSPSCDPEIVEAAGELLAETLGPGRVGIDAPAEGVAVSGVIEGLRAHGHALTVVGGGSSSSGDGLDPVVATARAVARIATAVAERDPGLITGECKQAVDLAELVLVCVSRPERPITEACIDYFLAVNTVPLAERHPQLRGPLFSALLGHLVRHAAYPAGFAGWEREVHEDQEAFTMFREQLLSDALESCYNLLRLQYLTPLHQLLLSSAASLPSPSITPTPTPGPHASSSTNNTSISHTTAAPAIADVGGQGWTTMEAAMYCLRIVGQPVKAHALLAGRAGAAAGGGAGPDGGGAAAVAAVAVRAPEDAFLLQLFADVCSPTGALVRHMANPWLLTAAAQLIGEYAAWFGRAQDSPLEAALTLLLHALGHPQCCTSAAAAFRNLCVRCGDRLSQLPVLESLIRLAAQTITPLPEAGGIAEPVGLSAGERAAVVEGLARIVSGLPEGVAAQMALQLVTPMIARAQSLAATGSPPSSHLPLLASELQLMAVALRFLETQGSAHLPPCTAHQPLHRPPALAALHAAWPTLEGVAGSQPCRVDAAVVEALCEVYQRALTCTKTTAQALVPVLLASVLNLFSASRSPACLDTLSTVVRLYGEVKSSAGSGQLQATALAGVAAILGGVLQEHPSPDTLAQHCELLRALFAMADHYLLFARSTLLSSPALPSLIAWAAAGVCMREKEPAAQVLGFLGHLLALPDKLTGGRTGGSGGGEEAELASQTARLEGCIHAAGPRLTHALVVSCCGSSSARQLLRPLAGCLSTLLNSQRMGQAAAAWLAESFGSPQLAALAPDLLQPSVCQRVCGLMLRRPPLNRGRFDALVSDFHGITTGEASADALVAYEM
ncbi:MAG: hypothetical protein WDW36_000215 [Sanguina aurantia]